MYAEMPTRGEDPLVTFHREAAADRVKLFELVWGSTAPARVVWQPAGAGYVAIWLYDTLLTSPTLNIIPKHLPVVNGVVRPWPQPWVRSGGDVWVNHNDRFARAGWFTSRHNADAAISCLITDLGFDPATSHLALGAVLANSNFVAGSMAINPSYAAFTTS